jgi:hypothetical protein
MGKKKHSSNSVCYTSTVVVFPVMSSPLAIKVQKTQEEPDDPKMADKKRYPNGILV